MFRPSLKKTSLILFAGVLLCLPAFSQSQGSLKKQGFFDLLTDNQATEVTITLDIDTLLALIKTDNYIPAEFRIDKKKDKKAFTLPVRVKSRGKFRRMVCDFPPLKLKFEKDDLKTKGLRKYNEFKLVTHCLEDEKTSKNLILREYLVYKLYNVLSPYSLRVQLLQITYQHKRHKAVKIKRWGILMEDLEEFADRHKGEIADELGFAPDSLYRKQEQLASTFQFMIGNCDWSYLPSRNTEFIKLHSGGIVPVPYDFDFAGIVNAPYARYDPSLGQTSLRDRVYLGQAGSAADLQGIFNFFKTEKEALYEVINGFSGVNKATKRDMVEYLESFFTLIEDGQRFEATFVERKKLEKRN